MGPKHATVLRDEERSDRGTGIKKPRERGSGRRLRPPTLLSHPKPEKSRNTTVTPDNPHNHRIQKENVKVSFNKITASSPRKRQTDENMR